MKRTISDPVVYTNGLFFINALLWGYIGYPLAALILTVTACASLSYHLPKESWKPTYIFDVCMAHFALLYTVSVAYPFISFSMWIILFSILVLGLYVKNQAHVRKRYDLFHTLWHVCVFVGQGVLAGCVYGLK